MLTPEEYARPDRLAKVPEALVRLAVANIAGLVDHDTALANELVRRVLAPLRLAEPDMPLAPLDHWPGEPETPLIEPMFTASAYRCPWGTLRRNGDVAMCALDEAESDGTPGPGHDTPGTHAFRDQAGDDIPFQEGDPRTFHAPAWLGESPELHRSINDMRHREERP